MNKNADTLSRIKINHFKQCVDFHSKLRISTSNEDETENKKEIIDIFDDNENLDELMTDLKIQIQWAITTTHQLIITMFCQNELGELHEKK